ncbi:MAG: DNA (cytosine-5-)-methyltransferase [Defluviitaleaceae bacterium]|nr:DNA (cytosine-5-)-methyltransferase [Defluviitaleaceae bacterium]
MIRYIDLFAGIGGMRIGFENALKELGISGKAVFSSEVKPYAIDAYKNYFTDVPFGDITKIHESSIPDFDFLLAGFPCQAFSSAGRRLGFEDARGTLFFDVARILKAKRPIGFLLENVEGLVNHEKGNTLRRMIGILEGLGYTASWDVLDGKDFGLAQSRKRIYITGNLKGIDIRINDFIAKHTNLASIIDYGVTPKSTLFTEKLLSHYSIDDVIGKKIKDKRGGANNIHSWSFALKGYVSDEQKKLLSLLLKQRRNKKWADVYGIEWMDGMPLTLEMIAEFYKGNDLKSMLDDLVEKGYLVLEHPKKKEGSKRVYDKSLPKGYNIVTGKLSFEYSQILNPDDIAPTLVATDVLRLGVPVNGGIRPLTVREGLRLFGFPEQYDLNFLSPNLTFDLLGNTVCIPVVSYVSKCILEGMLKNEFDVIRAIA